MERRCLICDEKIFERRAKTDTLNVHLTLTANNAKSFTLTASQLTILQRVLSMDGVGDWRKELMGGPYCRQCFTDINNVCHCMSALDNLRQSVVEFRRDVRGKLAAHLGPGRRKKGLDPCTALRQQILSCVRDREFSVGGSGSGGGSLGGAVDGRGREIAQILSGIDSPQTEVNEEMVIRTTNGNMPAQPHKRAARRATTPTTTPTAQLNPISVAAVVGGVVEGEDETAVNVSGRLHYRCPQCRQLFRTKTRLKTHVASHWRQCSFCARSFPSKAKLNKHLNVKHKREQEALTAATATPSSAASGSLKSRVSCDICHQPMPNIHIKKCHLAKTHGIGVSPTLLKHRSKSSQPNNGQLLQQPQKKKLRAGRCKVCSRIVTDLPGHLQKEHPDVKVNDPGKTKEETKLNDLAEVSDSKAKQTEEEEKSPDSSMTCEEKTDKEEDEKVSDRRSEEEKSSSLTEGKQLLLPSSLLIPSMAGISPPNPAHPTTTSNPSATSSKYQFKNLLKIGGDK